MADPWDELASRIEALVPEGTNIYPAMAQVPQAPAIVIIPDEPWFSASAFAYDIERYAVVCLAEAASPADAVSKIHALVHAVREAGGTDGWEIGEATAIRSVSIPDDGTIHLGSWVRVTYRNCEHEVEEGS